MMKISHSLYLCALLSLLLITTGCGQVNNEEALNHLALRVAKSYIGAETIDAIETPGSYPKPFNHPLKNIGEGGLNPTHVQLSLGETGVTDRYVTVLLENAVENLQLVLVDEGLEKVVTLQAELPLDEIIGPGSGLSSYTFNLETLMPDTHYLYALVSDSTYSKVYAFDTWPLSTITKIAVFGDLQGYQLKHYTDFRQILETMILEEDPQAIMLMGDIVDTGDAKDQWGYYYRATHGISDYLPTLASIGNHDVKGSRENYENTFIYPSNGLSELGKSTGYYDLPYARIVVIDTERPSLFMDQQAWLLKVMEDYEEGSKIVMMHRSVYPIFYVEPHMQVWAEVFEAAGIDLVLSGHDHIYSRTTMNEVTYIVTGSGSGSKFYNQDLSKPWQKFIYDDNQPVSILLESNEKGLVVNAYSFSALEKQRIDHIAIPID